MARRLDPVELANRIRDARNDVGMTQQDLADKIGTDVRSVQGWESGRRIPRDVGKVERALGADLRGVRDGDQGPVLADFADSQLVAEMATRLAERDKLIRELRRQLDEQGTAGRSNVVAPDRWAARPRRPDPE